MKLGRESTAAKARYEELLAVVRAYVNERENPAPDLLMRRIRYDHMREVAGFPPDTRTEPGQ